MHIPDIDLRIVSILTTGELKELNEHLNDWGGFYKRWGWPKGWELLEKIDIHPSTAVMRLHRWG